MNMDEVDRGILYLLQRDARRITTEEMGEKVGVSPSTVRNRIGRMEKASVIVGYQPIIDYDETGLQLHVIFICSAPHQKRDQLAKEAREVRGVVTIQEVLNGKDNIQIEAIGTDTDDIGRISDDLNELGLEVINSKILKSTHVQPFDHFGKNIVNDREE